MKIELERHTIQLIIGLVEKEIIEVENAVNSATTPYLKDTISSGLYSLEHLKSELKEAERNCEY